MQCIGSKRSGHSDDIRVSMFTCKISFYDGGAERKKLRNLNINYSRWGNEPLAW